MLRRVLFSLRVVSWLLLSLAVLEVCARIEDKIDFDAPFWDNYSSASLYTFDAGGRIGKPNARYLKWKLNEAGYRGPNLRPGTYRIACVGSSETFGLYESEDNEWPRQLERKLNRWAGSDAFDVVNAAYPGMSISTSIRRLDRLIQTTSPRLLVVYPSYSLYIDLAELDAPPEKGVPQHFESRLSTRVDTLLKKSVPARLQDWVRAEQVQHTAAHVRPMDRVPEANIERFKSDLLELVDKSRSRGVQVLLVTHCTRFGNSVTPEERPMLTTWRKFYPKLREDGFLDMERRMNQAVREVAVMRSVPMVEAAGHVEPGPKDFADFVHFTDRGADIFSGLVAGGIENLLVAPPPVRIQHKQIALAGE